MCLSRKNASRIVRLLLLMMMCASTSRSFAQERQPDSSATPTVKKLRAGERAPADGRWIAEPDFLLIWRRLQSLEDLVVAAEEERAKDISARRELEAYLQVARVSQEKAELQRVVAEANSKELERQLAKSWDTATVFSLIGGAAAVGLLVGVFVVGD